MAAFIGGGTLVYASSNNSTDTMEIVQDGKKKAKATKKEECKGDHKKGLKSECNDKAMSKKSCCSDGKSAKKKTTSPEKK